MWDVYNQIFKTFPWKYVKYIYLLFICLCACKTLFMHNVQMKVRGKLADIVLSIVCGSWIKFGLSGFPHLHTESSAIP